MNLDKRTKLLAISIPSYLRCGYLKDLLSCIKKEFSQDPGLTEFVDLYLYDNASPDATHDVVKASELPIIYKKNRENTGAANNIFQAYQAPIAEYVWVIGDDDLLEPRAIRMVVECLEDRQVDLLVVQDTDPQKVRGYRKLDEFEFTSYAEFISYIIKTDPVLLNHTLISDNVIRGNLFDEQATKNIIGNSQLPHMYGLLEKIGNGNHVIRISREPILILRGEDRHPPFEDAAHAKTLSPEAVWEVYKDLMDSLVSTLTWIIKKNPSIKNPREIAERIPMKGQRNIYFLKWRTYPLPRLIKEGFFLFYYYLCEWSFLRICIFEPIKRITGIRRSIK